MAERANSGLSADVAAAFAWWREAGVDHAFGDEPANWLAPGEEPTATLMRPRESGGLGPDSGSSEKARGPRFRGDAESLADAATPVFDAAVLPRDLQAFTAWWLADPRLDDGRTAGRVPPRGERGAALMIIVPEPEREDRESLLSGPQGRLLDAFLTAAGIAPESAYLASALPRHTPVADWAAAVQRGLGAALRRQIELVAPRRVIAFGRNVLPLLGNDLPNSGLFSLELNHGESSVSLLAAADLGALLVRPRAKARLWQQWLDWTGPERI
jgi:DNA polymerase